MKIKEEVTNTIKTKETDFMTKVAYMIKVEVIIETIRMSEVGTT